MKKLEVTAIYNRQVYPIWRNISIELGCNGSYISYKELFKWLEVHYPGTDYQYGTIGENTRFFFSFPNESTMTEFLLRFG